MPHSNTALVVIDVQESFRHRPYWQPDEVPEFLLRTQELVDGARRAGVPVLQVFHVEEVGAFSLASGYVTAMTRLAIDPTAVFYKSRHSALIGSGLDAWLDQHAIRRLIMSGIRTEQCCETTTRHAADCGYEVDFVTEATLTFPMTDRSGRVWSPEQIRQRTELVLDQRFARIVDVSTALERCA